MTLLLSGEALAARLDAHLAWEPAARSLAFDGDNTLWRGDVSDDVFLHATELDLLRPAALPALQELARAHGLAADGTASEVARRVYAAQRGDVAEATVFGMLAWCWAGFSTAELSELAEEVLSEEAHEQRLRPELSSIFELARRHDLDVLVVSASPRPFVEVAVRGWRIAADHVVAAEAVVEDGVIQPRLARPVPYGAEKAARTAELAPNGVLAAFGDSPFDRQMLELALVPVAVAARPELRHALAGLDRFTTELHVHRPMMG